MPGSERNVRSDPERNFKFQVSIVGEMGASSGIKATLATAGFMAVSGLTANNEMIPYREGGMNTTPRKLPGQTDFPPLQLSRGLFSAANQGHAMWFWFKEIFFHAQGAGYGPLNNNFRLDFIIRLLSHPVTAGPAAGNPVTNTAEGGVKAAWKVFNAWPQAISFSDFDAGGNAVAVNSMSLVHEGFDVSFGETGAVTIV